MEERNGQPSMNAVKLSAKHGPLYLSSDRRPLPGGRRLLCSLLCPGRANTAGVPGTVSEQKKPFTRGSSELHPDIFGGFMENNNNKKDFVVSSSHIL